MSVIGFVQQLATAYLPHGYWFYVTGTIPPHKDPRAVDAKLLAKYGIAISRSARARRKQAGMANLHYLRHERFFVILATYGQHAFFDEEQRRLRDIRRQPLIYAGYSISYKRGGHRRRSADGKPAQRDDRWHSRVQIARGVYGDWRAYFVDVATKRSASALAHELRRLPFEPYAPVRQQLLNLLRLVNHARRTAGMDLVSADALRYRRRIVRPFEPFDGSAFDDRNQATTSGQDDDKFD
ncbi:MAG: hypothetical protein KF708_06915 [Pirellulales bacterium]|nr:hypothetical protein [Pirellulales bacterium]